MNYEHSEDNIWCFPSERGTGKIPWSSSLSWYFVSRLHYQGLTGLKFVLFINSEFDLQSYPPKLNLTNADPTSSLSLAAAVTETFHWRKYFLFRKNKPPIVHCRSFNVAMFCRTLLSVEDYLVQSSRALWEYLVCLTQSGRRHTRQQTSTLSSDIGYWKEKFLQVLLAEPGVSCI